MAEPGDAGAEPEDARAAFQDVPSAGEAAAAAEDVAVAVDVAPEMEDVPPAGDATAGPPSADSLLEPCGTWVEQDDDLFGQTHLYRPTTFAFLTAEPERPGRVVVRAYVAGGLSGDCGPCPEGALCARCEEPTVMLTPFRGAQEDTAYEVLGRTSGGSCVDAYLALGPGYTQRAALVRSVRSPDDKTKIETVVTIRSDLCEEEDVVAEAEELATSESCLADPAPTPRTWVSRRDDAPLPVPRTLDVAELLRRAEASFAAGAWQEALDAYGRVERETGRRDAALLAYCGWRMAQCELRLDRPEDALNRLEELPPVRVTGGEAARLLPDAVAADLGRRLAASWSGEKTAYNLTRVVEGPSLRVALEAAALELEAEGRVEDAQRVRESLERLRDVDAAEAP
ncbi:MAG: tetratricopeptide repeat protein [Deltaproteobacteria bacterium]|nr:tetratricopeptide repeat protein [Deltaproteobacteria bacterium]